MFLNLNVNTPVTKTIDAESINTTVNIGGSIFGASGGYQNTFNGKIPVVHIYSRDLSDAEVLQNFNAQSSRYLSNPLTSNAITTTVNATSVAGSISGGGVSVVSGSNSTTLTLSGYTGSIQWQSSTTSSSSGFSNIGSATSATYTATNLSAATYYQAVVTNGVCTSATALKEKATRDAMIKFFIFYPVCVQKPFRRLKC